MLLFLPCASMPDPGNRGVDHLYSQIVKTLSRVCICAALSLCAPAQSNSAPGLHSFTAIRAGSVIDGKSDTVRRDQIIVIRGTRIDSITDAASAKIPSGANVIDLSHATVLPGLIDSHTHIFLQGEDPAQGGYDVNILKYPLHIAQRGLRLPRVEHWSRALRRCEMSKQKAQVMAT
jgi:imidazolonepropionase-like amidohydrolase